MKRSHAVGLSAAGAVAAVAMLTAEPYADGHAYRSVNDCILAKAKTPEACKASFGAARAQNETVAPKYASRQDCEDEFGKNQCSQSSGGSSGGGRFHPNMIGFLMQTDLGERGKIAPQPIYRLRTGEYLTAGGAHIDRLAGPVRVRPSQVGAPKPSTQTLSRGGFGRSARGYGG